MIYKRSIVNCTNNRINKSQLARYKNIVDIPSKMGLYIPQKERKTASYQRQCFVNMDQRGVLNRR